MDLSLSQPPFSLNTEQSNQKTKNRKKRRKEPTELNRQPWNTPKKKRRKLEGGRSEEWGVFSGGF